MSDPHFEYMEMRLLTRKRSGFSSMARIRACVHFPSVKSEVEIASRRKPNHCDEEDEDENSEAEVRRRGKRERKERRH